jgi:hypothetical protein
MLALLNQDQIAGIIALFMLLLAGFGIYNLPITCGAWRYWWLDP